MLGPSLALTPRPGKPGWVTPGASVDLRFADGLYYAAAPRALLAIPGLSASGGDNGTVVRGGSLVEQSAPRASDDGLHVRGAVTQLVRVPTAPTSVVVAEWGGGAGHTLTSIEDDSPAFAEDITGGKCFGLANSGGLTSTRIATGEVTSGQTVTLKAWVKVIAHGSGGSRFHLPGQYSNDALFDGLPVGVWTELSVTQEASSTTSDSFFLILAENAEYRISLPILTVEPDATGSYITSQSGSDTTRTADSVTLTMADLDLADDQEWDVTYDDGSTGTISAVAGTLTIPASAKAYARLTAIPA